MHASVSENEVDTNILLYDAMRSNRARAPFAFVWQAGQSPILAAGEVVQTDDEGYNGDQATLVAAATKHQEREK